MEQRERSVLDRALGAFGDVRAGESGTVLLLLANLFLLLAGYYVCKTVREPLILGEGGAELKSYASAFQAVALMGFIPLYGWFASRVGRFRLNLGVNLFFLICVEAFWLASRLSLPHLGIAFFVWVGIFSNAVIAQFWSYANDLYAEEAGKRLFPVVAIGATLGSPLGAELAEKLFERHADPFKMLHWTALALAVSAALYFWIERREARSRPETVAKPLAEGPGGFQLLLRSGYLRLICLLFLVLNVVNTTGEYILSRSVVEHAAALASDPSFDRDSYIGAFYGSYFLWVNVIAVVLQGFVVSRLTKYIGIAGVLFALPLVALGAYGFVAVGAGLALIRIAKTAENATDYSAMNTARQMLWLPTRREEKYKAKQAADTFVVRLGDVLAASFVWLGTHVLALGTRGFALTNLLLVAVWLALAFLLMKKYTAVQASSVKKQP
jgi:AAA family ATP:ADP antiporter